MASDGEDIFIDLSFEGEYALNPLVLADVGARGGLKKNWLAAQRHLRVLGFEPDRREYETLVERGKGSEDSKTYFHAALHHRQGQISFNITRDRGLSSLFEPNRPFLDAFPDSERFDITDVQKVDADMLDNLLAAGGISDLDFIKADTQGSELFVLQGAALALENTAVGVEVEVEFAPMYKDQPLFADVDAFMRGLGYFLFDLRPCYWKRAAGRDAGGPHGQIIWADALYLKGITALKAAMDRMPVEVRKSKVLRAISIALLYGYYDYALEITRSADTVLSADERTLITRRLRDRGIQRGLPRFPGRGNLAGIARRLWRRLRLPNEGWSVSDAGIGNVE